MFSSADVDYGTRLLLQVFSRILDEDMAAGKSLPQTVLDSGCGAGIIGICAAAALLPLDAVHSQVPGGNPEAVIRERRAGPAKAGPHSAETAALFAPGHVAYTELTPLNAVRVRCQDRDELARLVTLRNADKNHIPPSVLEAFTEPMLAGPSVNSQTAGWDLILTNIPAKAGQPVLEDFVRRSAGLLNPGGRVIMVAVHTLADFFRGQIAAAGAELVLEKKGSGHSVFVYGGKTTGACDKATGCGTGLPDTAGFFARYPFYIRTAAACRIEDIHLRLQTVHGASGFDNPGGAVLAAAKLVSRLEKAGHMNPEQCAPLLVHEPGQGFFPCWLREFLRGKYGQPYIQPVLSGRNILALEAARHNTGDAASALPVIVPAVDLEHGREALLEAAGGRQYRCIAAFPELLPQSSLSRAVKNRHDCDQLAIFWNALPFLLAVGGIILVTFGSADAERFDRKKPAGFIRLGTVKRNGFRTLAYRLGAGVPPEKPHAYP